MPSEIVIIDSSFKSLKKSVRPTFKVFLTLVLGILMVAQAPLYAQDGGGTCPSCGAPAHGGQGGGGGGGGAEAAAILAAIAAIVAPIAMAAAQVESEKIKAEADKDIAAISANSAITQTQMQADTTMMLADQQAAIARENTAATMELAASQQQASSERLQYQIQAAEQERHEAAEERAQIRYIEQQRSDQQIAFAKEQSQLQLQMAQDALNRSMQQQSLALSPNTGSQLTTNRALMGTVQASVGSSVASALNGLSSSRAITRKETPTSTSGARSIVSSHASEQVGMNPSTSRGIASLSSTQRSINQTSNQTSGMKRGFTVTSSRVANSGTNSSRLLAALRNDSTSSRSSGGSLFYKKNGQSNPSKATQRLVSSKRSPLLEKTRTKALRGVMQGNLPMVLGSTRAFHNSIQASNAVDGSSDLKRFTSAVRAVGRATAESGYRRHQLPAYRKSAAGGNSNHRRE